MQRVDFGNTIAKSRVATERTTANVVDVRRCSTPTCQVGVEAVPRHTAVHITELRVIEDVEHFNTQLKVTSAVTTELEVLEDREVGHINARPGQIVTRIGSLCSQSLRDAGKLRGFPVEKLIALLACVGIAIEEAPRRFSPRPAEPLVATDVSDAGSDVFRLT